MSAASYDELSTGIRFDRVLWQDPALVHGQDPIRIHMIDDLLACYELRGLPRHEITQLLGESDGTKRFATWDMVYWLGPERGFISIDSEWLVLRLDGNGKVVGYDVISD